MQQGRELQVQPGGTNQVRRRSLLSRRSRAHWSRRRPPASVHAVRWSAPTDGSRSARTSETSRQVRRREDRSPRPRSRRFGGRPDCRRVPVSLAGAARSVDRRSRRDISSSTAACEAALLGEIDEHDAASTVREIRGGCSDREADLVGVVDAGHRQPAPLSRQGKFHLERVCQPLALIGPASVDGAQVRKPPPPTRGVGAIRPTLTGTVVSSAAATSKRRRSRSEVMARNSTVPQPSAAPAMSPDARVSAMRRFIPPVSAAAGSITRLEDTMDAFLKVASCTDCCKVSICPLTFARCEIASLSSLAPESPAADSSLMRWVRSRDLGLQLARCAAACRPRERSTARTSCSARNSR